MYILLYLLSIIFIKLTYTFFLFVMEEDICLQELCDNKVIIPKPFMYVPVINLIIAINYIVVLFGSKETAIKSLYLYNNMIYTPILTNKVTILINKK